MEKIKRSEKDIEVGNIFTYEQVKEQMQQWISQNK